jgi:hypothetical protein
MIKELRNVTFEVLQAILPITIAVIALNVLFIRMPLVVLLQFIFGALMVMCGMILFLLGVRLGILPMGEALGSELPRRRFLPYILAIAFLIGFSVTVAERMFWFFQTRSTQFQRRYSQHTVVAVIAIGVGFL